MVRYFYCFLISLFCFFNFSCTRVLPELKTAEQLMETAPDSSLHILQKMNGQTINGSYNHALYALLLSQALDKNDKKIETDSLITIATDYFDESDPIHAGYAWFYHARTANNRGSVDEQAKNLLKAQDYVEKTEDHKLIGLVYGEKGQMYKNQQQYDSSICYYRKAFQILLKIHDYTNCILCQLNIGSNYLSKSDFDSALICFKKAERMAKNTQNTLLYSTIYRNIGSVYLKEKKYSEALINYHKVPLTNINMYDSNKWLLIANVFIKNNQNDSTRYYLHKVGVLTEMSTNYYLLWLTLHKNEGNYKEALYYAQKIIDTSDSKNKRKLKISFAGLEKKYKYQGLQITNQDLTIKNKQRGLLLLVTLLTLSIFVVVFLYWRLRTRNKELEYQKDIANKKQELLEKEKENTAKEKENNALLEKQLKFQTILLLNIEQHRDNSAKQTGYWNKKKQINKPAQNKAFSTELIACVDMEYNNISQRLKVKYPELSDNDIITCCLMLTGFETGMIATIFDVNIESIFIRRSRIRKKLNLEESEKLEHFLRLF